MKIGKIAKELEDARIFRWRAIARMWSKNIWSMDEIIERKTHHIFSGAGALRRIRFSLDDEVKQVFR